MCYTSYRQLSEFCRHPIDAKSRGNFCFSTFSHSFLPLQNSSILSYKKFGAAKFKDRQRTHEWWRGMIKQICLLYCYMLACVYMCVCVSAHSRILPQNTHTRYVKLNALTRCSHMLPHHDFICACIMCVMWIASINEWLRAFEFTTHSRSHAHTHTQTHTHSWTHAHASVYTHKQTRAMYI